MIVQTKIQISENLQTYKHNPKISEGSDKQFIKDNLNFLLEILIEDEFKPFRTSCMTLLSRNFFTNKESLTAI
jgi:hypothetical protein